MNSFNKVCVYCSIWKAGEEIRPGREKSLINLSVHLQYCSVYLPVIQPQFNQSLFVERNNP